MILLQSAFPRGQDPARRAWLKVRLPQKRLPVERVSRERSERNFWQMVRPV